MTQNSTGSKWYTCKNLYHLCFLPSSSHLQRQPTFLVSWVSFHRYYMHMQANACLSPLIYMKGSILYTLFYTYRFSLRCWSFIFLFYTKPMLLHPAHSHWEPNPGRIFLSFWILTSVWICNIDLELLPCFFHSHFEPS